MDTVQCPNCNRNIHPMSLKCVHCGTDIFVCKGCKKVYTEELETCPECGHLFEKRTQRPLDELIEEQRLKTEAEEKAMLPLKWFYFLIYFALYASAIINIGYAMLYFSGYLYTGFSSAYPFLKPVDHIIGINYLGMAALAMTTRFLLAKFKHAGVIILLITYGVYFALVLTEFILIAVFVRTALHILSSLVEVSVYGLFLILNFEYFAARRILFN